MVEYCCLCGQVEASSSIVVEDFETRIINEGCFKRVSCFIQSKETYKGQKGKKLTLKKSIQNSEKNKKKTFPYPYNQDCLSSCYQTILNSYGRFFSNIVKLKEQMVAVPGHQFLGLLILYRMRLC